MKGAGPAGGPAQTGLSRLLLGRVVAAAAAGRIARLAGAVDRRVVGGQVDLMSDGHAMAPLRLLHRDIRCRDLTVAIRSRLVGSKVWRARTPHICLLAGRATQVHACPDGHNTPTVRSNSTVGATARWPQVRAQSPTVVSHRPRELSGTAWAQSGHRMGTEAQKRRSPHGAGFVSACRHSCFLVAGARFELATFGL